jgi:uncharacterized membrane protein YphA (DoxX/SURF4 family)
MIDLADVLRILVALAFVAAGAAKLVLPPATVARLGMAVVAELPRRAAVAIGLLELLGAAGLVLPVALDVAPWLSRVAALGLAALMAGAAWTQLQRRRAAGAAIALTLLAVTLALAGTPIGPPPTPTGGPPAP